MALVATRQISRKRMVVILFGERFAVGKFLDDFCNECHIVAAPCG